MATGIKIFEKDNVIFNQKTFLFLIPIILYYVIYNFFFSSNHKQILSFSWKKSFS